MSSEVVVSSPSTDEQQPSPATQASNSALKKVNLLGMSRAELENFFEKLGEKSSVPVR